ncbi:MAG: nucleoside hydrolase [Labilibaculum sp.]|nr:nucleoside hydrolase [Labilibaculum sp.]MBI9060234.1 nucleoside hydrolase [Labilibaculum sp.]
MKICIATMLVLFLCLFGCKKEEEAPVEQMQERTRVLLDTDANNELDDQHAIAYMLFNGNIFDVEGITVNRTRGGGDLNEHFKEAERVINLCGLESKIKIFKGADKTFEGIKDDVKNETFDGSDAVNFIIERSNTKSDQKLVLLPVGKLTNIALALHKDPSIASKVRIVWLGSNYPEPGEYNQENDLSALEYILDLSIDFEIVTVRYGKSTGTAAVYATKEEIEKNMSGKGPQIKTLVVGRHGKSFNNFGDYSVNLFSNCDFYGDPPHRSLFDMAAVAIVKDSTWAIPIEIPTPKLVEGNWIDRPENSNKIIIWENFDKEKIMNDFYSTMENYVLVN